jgi:glycosidase
LDSFDSINPELDDISDKRSVVEEAKAFADKAHELDMNVIVDLPGCASYDLSLRKPAWFERDDEGKSQVVADWTDVRQLKIDNNLIENVKKFIDVIQNIGFDGIRADVAAIKPAEFWSEVISYARKKNPEFLFLAEASPEWTNPSPKTIKQYLTPEELLNSGFDSYYGSWSDFKNIKTKEEFDNRLEKNLKIIKKYKNSSMISALATHDQQAPILRGKNYWNMVLWLCVTLPQNTYFLDGFSVADNYIYPYENMRALNSSTDDDEYFVHNGQFDIFNATGPIRKKHPKYKQNYLKAINFKKKYQNLITNGEFKLLKTNNDKVFAYSVINDEEELIAVGSLDEEKNQKAQIKSLYVRPEYLFSQYSGLSHPKINKENMEINLAPLEMQVYIFTKVNIINQEAHQE